jgi:hypothetical protein
MRTNSPRLGNGVEYRSAQAQASMPETGKYLRNARVDESPDDRLCNTLRYQKFIVAKFL